MIGFQFTGIALVVLHFAALVIGSCLLSSFRGHELPKTSTAAATAAVVFNIVGAVASTFLVSEVLVRIYRDRFILSRTTTVAAFVVLLPVIVVTICLGVCGGNLPAGDDSSSDDDPHADELVIFELWCAVWGASVMCFSAFCVLLGRERRDTASERTAGESSQSRAASRQTTWKGNNIAALSRLGLSSATLFGRSRTPESAPPTQTEPSRQTTQEERRRVTPISVVHNPFDDRYAAVVPIELVDVRRSTPSTLRTPLPTPLPEIGPPPSTPLPEIPSTARLGESSSCTLAQRSPASSRASIDRLELEESGIGIALSPGLPRQYVHPLCRYSGDIEEAGPSPSPAPSSSLVRPSSAIIATPRRESFVSPQRIEQIRGQQLPPLQTTSSSLRGASSSGIVQRSSSAMSLEELQRQSPLTEMKYWASARARGESSATVVSRFDSILQGRRPM
ncbi:hypothetical protein KEM55_002869 [Ascosphaera atra]|nr:hypothetical protein KEM55_002869 [Ascosphaera atra]